jgi:hypothetical protein
LYYLESQRFLPLRPIVIISAVVSLGIIALHLYTGIKNYKKHKLQLFKGMHDEIPSVMNFQSSTIASNSVRYFGFLVGHMTCGFIVLFHLIMFMLLVIRITPHIDLLLSIAVPAFVIYLLTMVGTSSVGQCLFMQDIEGKLNIRNRKIYGIFVYFNFFISKI